MQNKEKNIKHRLKESIRIKVLILFFSVLIITILFPRGEAIDSDVKVNSIWIKNDLISSIPFEILKDPVVYEREKFAAIRNVSPVFVFDLSLQKKQLDSLKSFNNELLKIIDSDEFYHDDGIGKTFLSEFAYRQFFSLRRDGVNIQNKKFLIGDIFGFAESFIKNILSKGLLNVNFTQIDKDSIAVQQDKFQILLPKWNFIDVDSANRLLAKQLYQKFNDNTEITSAVKEYINHFLTPNLIYSPELTKIATEHAVSKVSKNIGLVNENERIVAKHDRITPEIKAKIDSYRKAKGAESSFLQDLIQSVGIFIHILLLFSLLSLYLYLFRQKIFNDNSKLLLISFVILFISVNAYLVLNIEVQTPIEYLIFVPVASMILTIVFDSRVGFYSTVVCAMIVGALRGNDYALVVTNLVAGGFAAYTVRDIKNRKQIFRSFLFILIAYTVSIFAFGLERFDSVIDILGSLIFASVNSIFSPALTFGLIIFIERLFNIVTDLSLIELSSANTPILRELARNAPGTNSHSHEIALMAEAAAIAIGANPILVKTGAYYHDIGKLKEPENFVENQLNNFNIHENLDPLESTKLIVEHVNYGIQLAEQNNLPQEIIDFIPMHHGTSVINYFYEKAKTIYGEDKVNINDFRYPGPKPNTKETAILMLADACQSAVKSISQPDINRIENMINNLIQVRIDDGQLSEAPLTFKDIYLIKNAFINYLSGSLHKRIRYPNQSEMENNIQSS